MKKIFTAIFSFILVAQLPMNAPKFVSTEWMKSIQYGLKWSELMIVGYPGSRDTNEESIPQGHVTTTVTMASAIPDAVDIQATADPYLCEIEYQKNLSDQARQVIKAHTQLQTKIRLQRIRMVRAIHM